MADQFVVVGGVEKKAKEFDVVVGGQIKKVKELYEVVDGKLRKCWTAIPSSYSKYFDSQSSIAELALNNCVVSYSSYYGLKVSVETGSSSGWGYGTATLAMNIGLNSSWKCQITIGTGYGTSTRNMGGPVAKVVNAAGTSVAEIWLTDDWSGSAQKRCQVYVLGQCVYDNTASGTRYFGSDITFEIRCNDTSKTIEVYMTNPNASISNELLASASMVKSDYNHNITKVELIGAKYTTYTQDDTYFRSVIIS